VTFHAQATPVGYGQPIRRPHNENRMPADLMEYVDQAVAAYRDEKRENPRLP
jgi:hypothetical protein